MATTQILTQHWKLDDGILAPFVLPAPLPVADALIEQGVLAPVDKGMGSRAAEWISLRNWRYQGVFELPEEEDERCALRFDRLMGRGALFVNGVRAAQLEPGARFVDITGLIRPSRNEFELRFDASPRPLSGDFDAPIAKLGIAGPVWLETYNYLALNRLCAIGSIDDGRAKISFRSTVDAFTAGKYTFKYMISDDSGAVQSGEFIERLPAASREIEHTIALPEARIWSPDDRQCYDWRLSIERTGVGCQLRRGSVAFLPEAEPMRCVSIAEEVLVRPDMRPDSWLEALGVDAVCPPEHERRPLWGEGFRVGDVGERFPCVALALGEKLRELAAEEMVWPPDQPAWRLRGSTAPDLPFYEVRFGPGAADNADRLARLSRFVQAEQIAAEAICARIERRAAPQAQLIERYPHFASNALIEFDGRLRPAFWALAAAWRPVRGWAHLPDGAAAEVGSLIEIPIHVLAFSPVGLCNITATAHRMDGSVLQGVSLPTVVDGNRLAGRLSLHLPGEPSLVIVRVEITDAQGALIDRSDWVLAASSGDAPWSAALNPPRARLKVDQGRLMGDEHIAALGVSISTLCGGFCYGALLPGQSIDAPHLKAEQVEWLNGA